MAKVKRFGQGGSSSEPKRYIKRGPNGAQPASKPPVYQKEVAVRKPSDASSTNSKDVASKAKSTGIRPKVYEGELNGGEVANRSKSAGNIGRDAIEGERVVSNRGSSSASSTGGKGVSSSPTSSSRAVSPKVYEGEVSGSIPKNASGKASGNVYEGERVSKPVARAGGASEGAASRLSNAVSKGISSASGGSRALSALSKAAPIVGRGAAGLAAAPIQIAAGALMPSDLEKDETPYKGSKDSYTPTSARDRAADLLGQPKAKAATPDVEIKKTEIVKTAPAASKPALKLGASKPKGPTEGDRARNSMADEWAAFSKGREADTAALKDITDRYSKTGTLVNPDEENARTKTEATEALKKGGMTKRPPKPAKKVPPRKFASGRSVSRTSASKRGDGCATKGRTKGKYLRDSLVEWGALTLKKYLDEKVKNNDNNWYS